MNNLYGVERIDDLKPCSRGMKWGVRRKAKPVKKKKKPKDTNKIQVIE